MNLQGFKAALAKNDPPEGLAPALKALWWDAKGDWNKAHGFAQQVEDDKDGQWVHAYLHRKEGDLSNAGYWYRQAGKPVASASLDAEWETIVKALLAV